MIEITESAKLKIADVLLEEQLPFLRTFVQGGGCSGFQYGFTLDETQNEDDFAIEISAYDRTFKILIDAMSMQYLNGATIDYKEDLNGSQFSIKNPNAQTTCGCGSSFSV